MLYLISKGGILMYPIILMSIISFTIFFERLYSLRMAKYISKNTVKQIAILIDSCKTEEALNLCYRDNTHFSRVLSKIIKMKKNDFTKKENMIDLANEYVDEELSSIYKYQDTIATIVNLAPLLGLLGTILGMIRTFEALSMNGVGSTQTLSGGIAEALLTTAAGLLTAIPAQIFHQIITYKADKISNKITSQISHLTDIIFKGNIIYEAKKD